MSSFRIALQSIIRSNILPNYRRIHTAPIVFAGHSKWQNIKHIKGAKDQQKSLLYNRLVGRIKYAVGKQGGADPKLNKEFGDVLEECRKANMPNSTIDRAVKRAIEKKYVTVRLEVIGPENTLLILDAEVENRNLFKNEVRKILKKYVGFGFADEGRALSAFEEKGVVRVRNKDGKANFDQEKMEEIAIEAEAEDVQIASDDETVLMFIGDKNSHVRIKSFLEETHPDDFVIVENGVEYVPYHRIEASDPTMEVLANAINEAGELEGINRIYCNF